MPAGCGFIASSRRCPPLHQPQSTLRKRKWGTRPCCWARASASWLGTTCQSLLESPKSERKPFLSLIIRLDIDVLRTLGDVLDSFEMELDSPQSLEVSPVSEPLSGVLERYLALADDPVEAAVLLPVVEKELHFRLLRSESGEMLRALANRESHASNIGRAIRALRERFRERLDVTELAKSVGMSASSFHRHFKSMTKTTPLQYQKDLRLTEARRLLRMKESTVSSAAFRVGYESPSQFSREYSRKFGASPSANLEVA